ncbi:SigE family RNA polymerase sigma factor [Micromonospora sp. NBC_01699]|uniref:SigE family RNA polymerase sigma factor n=1 Tax=Micromonospora sp. NBC_01699 TaxID=2975984 RepID=UPI002E2B69B4|nr:SigE family RNA polymerase sigma factor [Micromonospora sp. NBC_01699]
MVEFDDYVRLRGARLVQLARLLVSDRHLAEDLVQEVLGKAYVRWHRIAQHGDPDVYLRRMLVNANSSWWRRRSSGELATGTIVDRSDRVDIAHQAVERDATWRLVAELPTKQRAAVVLRFYEDLDDATIAEILQCSAVTVRTQTMRALATLRQRLGTPPALSSEGKQR